MHEAQNFTSKTGEPFGVNGMDDLGSCDLEVALICIILNDELFMLSKLVQTADFIGTISSWEWARIFRCDKRSGANGESGVFSLVKDHANVSLVAATIGGQDSRKYCFAFTCELVHVFIDQLAFDLCDLKFLQAFFNVLFDAHSCNGLVPFEEEKN